MLLLPLLGADVSVGAGAVEVDCGLAERDDEVGRDVLVHVVAVLIACREDAAPTADENKRWASMLDESLGCQLLYRFSDMNSFDKGVEGGPRSTGLAPPLAKLNSSLFYIRRFRLRMFAPLGSRVMAHLA